MPHTLSTYVNWMLAAFVIGTSMVATLNGQQHKPGLVVDELAADSAAAKAGIRIGDRLLTYDGKELVSPAAVLALQENTFGKKEVKLSLLRQGETLNFSVPSGALGIKTRPNLSTAALKLYEETGTALQAKQSDEAVAKLKEAAQVSAGAGEKSAAAWLYRRAAENYEAQRKWKEAIVVYEAALELLKDGNDNAAKSRTMFALGRFNQNINDYVVAVRWFEQARQVDQAAGNEMWVADDLIRLGNSTRRRGDLQAAKEYHLRALAIGERLAPNSLQVAASLSNLGNVTYDQGEVQVAQDYHLRSLAIRERLAPDSFEVAISLNSLGTVVYSRGDLQSAHDYYSRALAVFERLEPDSLTVAIGRSNVGMIAWHRGDLQLAQDYYSSALAIRERIAPDSLEVADSLDSLGLVASERGDLRSAENYHRNALAIKEHIAPNSPQVANSLNNLSLVASARGDLEAAQDYLSRALAIQERLAPNSLDFARSLGNLGLVASERGDLQSAHDYLIRALAIFERLGPSSLDIGECLNGLGIVATNRGDLQTAQDYHSRALAIQERLAPNSLDTALSLNNLGLIARDQGNSQSSLGHFKRALGIRERLAPNSLAMSESLNYLGDLAARERRFTEARYLFERAVKIIEDQRSRISSAGARALLLARYATPFTGLLRAHLQLNDLSAAFATAERARARSLVELLAERRLDLRSDAPASLIKQQDELDQKRSAAYSALAKLDSTKDAKQIEELQGQLVNHDLRQRELETQIRRASPKLARLKYPEPLDLKAVQAALDSGTLLLSYYVDQQQTYLFAVTKASIKLFRLPITETDLNKQTTEFQNQVSVQRLGNSTEEANKQGAKLYETLIGPAKDMVQSAKRVLVCPDGPLHTLPFAALVSRVKPKLRYLSEEKPLHTIVSMTVYAEIRLNAAQAEKKAVRVLAFGDPIYTKEQVEAAMGASIVQVKQEPVSNKKNQTPGDAETDYLQKRGLKFDARLTHTRQEVQEIARLFGPSATIKLDKEATETSVRQESKDYAVVHFAVHGWLDEQIGLNSGLVLSRPELLGKQATKDDNGLLQAWEILEHVQLDADLVVLSACETGLGQRLRGEGLIGLTRAMQYAGARSIVVSLWGVNDESTAAFMQAFYSELKRGASKDVALQKAMTVVRSNPKWSHPFYWSPFVLAGSWN